MLLSDVSQADADGDDALAADPIVAGEGVLRVQLTQVVRSTQRIVHGAASFGHPTAQTSAASLHESPVWDIA